MILGMTGTRKGMTSHQKDEFRRFLIENEGTELHHGDCIGADEEAHGIALDLGLRLIIHPPTNPANRAFCYPYDEILLEKEYMARNRDIVNASALMFAAPKGYKEELRSGTWAAIRYTIKIGKYVYICYPSQ